MYNKRRSKRFDTPLFSTVLLILGLIYMDGVFILYLLTTTLFWSRYITFRTSKTVLSSTPELTVKHQYPMYGTYPMHYRDSD